MSKRKFLKVMEGDRIQVDIKQESQQIGQSFLYNLLLPFIETYFITIAYFAVPINRKQVHDEDNLYQKIQWILETFYSEGLLKFYESCMLESIKNAVKKFTTMGILSVEKKQIKRNTFKTYITVSKDF